MTTAYDDLNTIDDIRRLIAHGIRESTILEYKREIGDNKDLAKDVAAMANSSGGTIIFGIDCDKSDKTLPTSIVPVTIGKYESIDQVINSAITPPVAGWEKKAIPQDKPEVVLLKVPASETTPHMADSRYFHRSGTESRPMTHDLVAMHFGRRIGPLLKLHVERIKLKQAPSTESGPSYQGIFRLIIENSGRKVAKFANGVFSFPIGALVNQPAELSKIDHLRGGRPTRQYDNTAGVIHAGTTLAIADVQIRVPVGYVVDNREARFLEWRLIADEMESKFGSFSTIELFREDE